MVEKIIDKYPALKEIDLPDINLEVFEYLKLFNDQEDLHITCLVQNIFGKTDNVEVIHKNYGHKIAKNILALNQLHDLDRRVLSGAGHFKNIIILYLSNFKFLFKYQKLNSRANYYLNYERAKYAMDLLQRLDITELRQGLEDDLFAYLEPKIFHNYHTLLKFTSNKYLEVQQSVLDNFQNLFKRSRKQAEIQTRLKTICSIHHKIIARNLLFSQVLDTIGLRIIVDTVEECYSAMALVLNHFPIISSRIKDYIAVPKDNGYKSIHLTILVNEHPVEIQIRTKEMHQFAQYGRASHVNYKQNYASEENQYQNRGEPEKQASLFI